MRDLGCRNAFFRRAVNFDPITSREHERFRATSSPQNAIGLSAAGEALARLHVCGVMAQADTEKNHGNGWVCTEKVIPQRSVNAALNPITQRPATHHGAKR